jgi:hypothetical protein
LPKSTDSSFAGLDASRRAQIMPLLGILRLANAFDEKHENCVTGIKVEWHKGSLLALAEGLPLLSATAQRIARARYLLESLCQCAIMVRPHTKKASPAVRRARTSRQTAAAGD